MSGLDDEQAKPKPKGAAKARNPPADGDTVVAKYVFKREPEEAPAEPEPAPEPEETPAAPRAEKSPRLRAPKHHKVVREDAGRRRRAITIAGVMLLIASALGAYTAVGVLGQLGAHPPASIPNTPVEVQGAVTDDETNEPLPGVDVLIVGSANENVSTPEGWYFLAPVPPGTYTLEASKAGYKTIRKTVNVLPGIPPLVDFAMIRGLGTIEYPPEHVSAYQDPSGPQLALGLAILMASAFAALGGWSAVTHRHYLLAVGGAAGGAATIGLVFGIPLGSVLAIAALATLASLKTGFLEAQSHRIPWEGRSPRNRRSRQRSR